MTERQRLTKIIEVNNLNALVTISWPAAPGEKDEWMEEMEREFSES